MLKAQLGHVTLFAENPDLLAEFYRNLFGMELVGRDTSGSSVFIGGRPQEENHELVFIHNRKVAHIGLKVNSPGELLAYYQEVKARGMEIFAVYNHGMALALYVRDPEGNLIELYWPTGREDYHPPHFGSLDLEGQTEESLRKLVAEMPAQTQRHSAEKELHMSTEDNKALVRRFLEELNQGNQPVIDELFVPDFVRHDPAGGKRLREEYRRHLLSLHEALPGQLTIEDLFAEGEKVVVRYTYGGAHQGQWRGVPPTGRKVTFTGIFICRILDGKIVEGWENADTLGLVQQLGMIPAPGQAS